MTDPSDLPYAENGGFAPKAFRVFCVLLSVILTGLKYTVLPAITWTDIGTPFAALGALYLLHFAIRSAVHEATRLADADGFLDETVTASIKQDASRTLTPHAFKARISEMAE